MQLNTFLLEDYYGKYEFSTKFMLSSSDAESWDLQEILNMAEEHERTLWREQRLGYTEVKGLPLLRQTIAKELYPSLNENQILCFAGAEEGIFCSLLTLCSPGDHVIVLSPCYQSLSEVPKFVGCSVTEIALREENEWKIDIEQIRSSIKTNTKCVIVNFPHNPTGQVISPLELQTLISLLQSLEIWLFSDEVYHLMGDPNCGWAKPAALLYSKAISLGVMSKAYGMAGLRIGWIACQDQEFLEKVARTKQYTSLCNSGPAEIISTIALKNKGPILKRNNLIVKRNLEILDDFFERYSKLFSWVRPQGGCTGFVKYLGKETAEQLCKQLIKEGILLLPSYVYHLKSNHFRIGFGRQNMPEVLALFEKHLKENVL